nr:MAG TPA: hypothetical protein [Caudoviricetes sp.]
MKHLLLVKRIYARICGIGNWNAPKAGMCRCSYGLVGSI